MRQTISCFLFSSRLLQQFVRLFANRNIRSLASLEDFPHLNCLCIDGNQLENLDFLRRNYSLGELYAGNNHISNIKGALSHLTNLRVLHLQNNQISNLKTLAYELRHLTGLEDLSEFLVRRESTRDYHADFAVILGLFDNPVTFARGYRSTIIDLLPKLRVLDRKSKEKFTERENRRSIASISIAVSNEERARAFDECHPDRRKVLDQFAFAFHLETKPSNENPTKKKLPPQPTSSTTKPSVQIQETPKPQE